MDERGRSQVFMTAMVQVFGLSPFRALLRDVSQGGCKIATGTPLRQEEIVLVTLPGVGEVVAFVVWSDRGFTGLRFERAVDADRLIGRRLVAEGDQGEPVPLSQWQGQGLRH